MISYEKPIRAKKMKPYKVSERDARLKLGRLEIALSKMGLGNNLIEHIILYAYATNLHSKKAACSVQHGLSDIPFLEKLFTAIFRFSGQGGKKPWK